MKMFSALALLLMFAAPAAFAAEGENGQAREIAFARPCAAGQDCDAPAASGYVLHVATAANKPASCPKGFSLLKDQKMGTLANGSLQIFACIKG